MSEVPVFNKFNESLAELFDDINRIFSGQISEKKCRLQLYTLVYNHCNSSLSSLAESKLFTTATGRQKHLLPVGVTHQGRVVGGELYFNAESYSINYVKNLRQMSDGMSNEDLLQFYVDEWNKYRSSSKILHFGFSYLHRHWMEIAHQAGLTSVHDVFTLLMLIWRKYLWKSLKDKLIDACWKLVELHHLNQVVDIKLIDDLIKSYKAIHFPKVMYIWLDNSEITVPCDNIYSNYFENPFIQNIEKFYRSQAVFDFERGTILEYLEKITPYINKDIEYIYPYLHDSTQLKMLELINGIFFQDHLDRIYNQTDILIENEDIQGLKIIYESIKHLSDIKNNIATSIEDHFNQVTLNAIERVSGTAINDPKFYIETIIDIHKTCFQVVQESFSGEQYFTAALDKVCGKFINNNTVTQTAGGSKKSPELLARYCDALLRKGNKTVEETDLEEKLNQIIIIFNYIEDKDVFLRFYQKMLAKRLIGQLSVSDDYEALMISKLKQTCGFEYTSKLEQMFQDTCISKNLIDQYRNFYENKDLTKIINFSVMVLSSNSWPFSISSNIILPIELKAILDRFTEYYSHQHSDRKLIWLDQHSKGELQTYFTSHKYTLQVSTYQMVILLLFNKSLSWTVEQIQDETEIKSELLIQILCYLLQSKILVCSEINENFEETAIKMNYTIKLVNDFKSEKFRINLNVPLKSFEQKSNNDLNKTIDEERTMIIQAAIVRIMKARKTLKHSLLMQEVIQQLSSRFKPNILLIKKCIDILIEKEYLERVSNENDVLRYLA